MPPKAHGREYSPAVSLPPPAAPAPASASASPTTTPVLTLLRVFALWKTVLLLIAAGSLVGPAYDSSPSLIIPDDASGGPVAGGAELETRPLALLTRLSSWDAMYFLQLARRGYQFEQEWAFGGGLPVVISSVLKVLESLDLARDSSVSEALVGVILAHVSHLLSVLALFWLGRLVWRDQRLALVAACLHIFSPAGLFLSAPYAESAFSLLSFAGHLLLARSCLAGPAAKDGLTLAAGVILGVATAFRSNGILNGIPFLYDFLQELWFFFTASLSLSRARRIVVLGVAGLCVAAGSVVPQTLAYLQFCSGASGDLRRPWCDNLVPSIFTFAQSQYWDVGLFRYWAISNLGLFLLAAPMLWILLKSGWDIISSAPRSSSELRKGVDAPRDACVGLIRSLAAAQMFLAVTALTSYHVQIIMRLSSAYPVWYWWLARRLASEKESTGNSGRRVVVFMIMYASIQAVLFSSFLPPA